MYAITGSDGTVLIACGCSVCSLEVRMKGKFHAETAKQLVEAWNANNELRVICEDCLQDIAEAGVV